MPPHLFRTDRPSHPMWTPGCDGGTGAQPGRSRCIGHDGFPCNTNGDRPLRIIDVIEFTAERILPPSPKLSSLALHPTCSSTRMGLNADLATVAGAIAERVDVPDSWGCCAFAGDRGMLHPELTAAATERQAREIAAFPAEAHASCNRTCELGMTRATGREYRHILELLNELTSPKTDDLG